MPIAERSVVVDNLTPFRFGFNEQEKADEVSGRGNHNTALFWEYDTRLGRRWNLDPIDQVRISNYSINGLNPIANSDPLGNLWYANDKGYFVWDDDASVTYQGFDHLIGSNLPEGISKNRILVQEFGGIYYKYSYSLLGHFSNWVCNCDNNPTRRLYSDHDALFNVEWRDYVVLGSAFKLIRPLYTALKGAGGSIWKLASYTERGFVYEALRGGNLVKNYPVIDKFIKGTATSIKTMDLGAKTYQNSKNVFSTLKGYIDKLAKFEGANVGGVNTAGKIEKRVLDLGVPRGASAEQAQMLERAIKYGKENNVEVIVNTVK